MSCDLCGPSPHENGEKHTEVWIEIPGVVVEEGMVDVCLEHYEAIQEAVE